MPDTNISPNAAVTDEDLFGVFGEPQGVLNSAQQIVPPEAPPAAADELTRIFGEPQRATDLLGTAAQGPSRVSTQSAGVLPTKNRQASNVPDPLRMWINTFVKSPEKRVSLLAESGIPAFVQEDGSLAVVQPDGSLASLEVDGFMDAPGLGGKALELTKDVIEGGDDLLNLAMFALANKNPVTGSGVVAGATGAATNAVRGAVAEPAENAILQGFESAAVSLGKAPPGAEVRDLELQQNAADGLVESLGASLVEAGFSGIITPIANLLARGPAKLLDPNGRAMELALAPVDTAVQKGNAYAHINNLIRNHSAATPADDAVSFAVRGIKRRGGEFSITGVNKDGARVIKTYNEMGELPKQMQSLSNELSKAGGGVPAQDIYEALARKKASLIKKYGAGDVSVAESIEAAFEPKLAKIDSLIKKRPASKVISLSELEEMRKAEGKLRKAGGEVAKDGLDRSSSLQKQVSAGLVSVYDRLAKGHLNSIKQSALAVGDEARASQVDKLLSLKDEWRSWNAVFPTLKRVISRAESEKLGGLRGFSNMGETVGGQVGGLGFNPLARVGMGVRPSNEFFRQGKAAAILRGEEPLSAMGGVAQNLLANPAPTNLVAEGIPMTFGVPLRVPRSIRGVLEHGDGFKKFVFKSLEQPIAEQIVQELDRAVQSGSAAQIARTMGNTLFTFPELRSFFAEPKSEAQSEFDGEIQVDGEVGLMGETVEKLFRSGKIGQKQRALMINAINRRQITNAPKPVKKPKQPLSRPQPVLEEDT